MLSPSDVFLHALHHAQIGVPYEGSKPTHCAMCAKTILPGEPHSPLKAGELFSDTRDLGIFSGVVCGACAVVRKKTALNGLAYCVSTQDAIYPIARDEHKAWLLLTPPKPPFVAVHSSTKMMHLIWRTPVTLSQDLIVLRYGLRVLYIRPARLRVLVELAQEILEKREAAGEKAPWRSPFISVDRDFREPSHGQIHPKAMAVMSEKQREFLTALTPGEVWASGVLLKAKPPVPTMPEPISIVI
jgi:CRISPR type IV-associated protein Csf1